MKNYIFTSLFVGFLALFLGGATPAQAANCAITSFTVSESVDYQGRASIAWVTTPECTNVSITPGIGPVANSGTMQSSPLTASTSFTLSATGGPVTQSEERFVTVSASTNGTSLCKAWGFTAVPSTIANGQSTELQWNTSGCTQVTISGGTVSVSGQMTGSTNTGTLTGTTTYSLYASNNKNATSRTVTVYVTGGSSSFQYACADEVDNDGDGAIDYPADSGCRSQFDTDEANSNTPTTGTVSVLTTAATKVQSTSVRLQGFVQNPSYTPVAAYFEYGTSQALTQQSDSQKITAGGITYYATIDTNPNTTYYYRAVATRNGEIYRGSIMSFTTKVKSAETTTPTPASDEPRTGTIDTNDVGVFLTITADKEKYRAGDTVEYTITYKNNTNNTLKNVILNVVLPEGFTAKQASQGRMLSLSTIEADLGTLAPAQEGSIYLEAGIEQNVAKNDNLVTTGTLTYTLPSGEQDNAVGYVLIKVTPASNLAGLALGSGFFPTTFLGWMFTIIFILIIVLIARRVANAKKHGGHGGGHGGGH